MPAYEKTLEIIIKKQLNVYIIQNNIIAYEQSGFRKNYSCETALNRVLNDWKKQADLGKLLICIFLDLKRAFETIDRAKLIAKLENIGIKDNERKWFESYLSNRSQKTKINDTYSDELNNNMGVPQGTVLASLLFSIYMNDICDIIEKELNLSINLRADDTEIHISTDDLNIEISKMQQILDIIQDYFKRNKLKINASKTKYMIVKSKYKFIDMRNIVLKIGDENIECVHDIKYLGVIIDDQLKFDKHTDNICKKASSKAGLLNRIKHKLKLENRICIYKTIVAPHFEYCSTILFLLNESRTKRLQKIQNKAMRAIMIVNKRTSIKLMLVTLNWMSINQKITMRTVELK